MRTELDSYTGKKATYKKLGTLAAAAVFCCATAFAQQGGAMPQSAPQNSAPNSTPNSSVNNMDQMQNANSGASMADRIFLKNALQGSMAEVQTAQLALSKTSNDQVKQFAQTMIDDHTKLIEQTKPVAMQNGVNIPSGPSKKDQAEMAKLQALSGDAFDKAYMKDMVKDHKADNNDFKSEAESGQSQQVKDLAAKGDPIIESHLKMAESVAKSIGATQGM
jgi:putative membrane protein